MVIKLKIFSKLKEFHSSCLPTFVRGDKKNTCLFYFSLYSIAFSIFFTIFGQLPVFTSRGLTQLFQIGWIVSFFSLLILDYKRFIRLLVVIVLLVVPFLLYCLICVPFKIPSFSNPFSIYVLLSSFLFVIGSIFGKYKNNKSLKLLMLSFIVAALIYAFVVLITKLNGSDSSNPLYVFGDKNSAGPIFISAATLTFYFFRKASNPLIIIIKWIIISLFVVVVALSKNRAVLITIPILINVMILLEIKNSTLKFAIFIAFILLIISLFAVPFLRQTIIINILLNGKTNWDDVSSGRISQIINQFTSFKPLLGDGNSYIDCMPLLVLCSFGVFGFVSLIPFLTFPFYLFTKEWKLLKDSQQKHTLILIFIIFLINALFEGYGHIGTGAKVFIFWFIVGSYFIDAEEDFILFKKCKFSNAVLYPEKHINANSFVFFGHILLCLTGIALVAIPQASSYIGSIIVDKLPTSNKVIQYNKIIDAQIKMPIESMCVGQTIRFEIDKTPQDADDLYTWWSAGSWIQNPKVTVNSHTGDVTAISPGRSLVNMRYYNRDKANPETLIQFSISETSNYDFDKLYISTQQFEYSFDYLENDSITLKEGHTSTVYYDKFYVPDNVDVDFYSTDESVATIDKKTGVIRGVSSGKCFIEAKINNAFSNKSLNRIEVNVEQNTSFTPVTSFDVRFPDSTYQFQNIVPEYYFNDEASDRNVNIEINGVMCFENDEQVSFSKTGTNVIKFIPLNNPSLSKEVTINVLENKPVSFGMENGRIFVGEKKTFGELGIFLEFENGFKKEVTDDDLLFDPGDFSDRAWTDYNGYVNNRSTIMAVKNGNIKISLITKDSLVSADFNIISSIYTESEFYNLCTNISIVIFDLFVCFALSSTIFVYSKRKWITYLSPSILIFLYLLLLFVRLKFSLLTIVSLILILSTFACVVLIISLPRFKTPYSLVTEPPKFIPLKYNENNLDNQFFETSI